MPRPITVLHVVEVLEDFGGSARLLLYLAKHAYQAGLHLAFLCFRDSPLQSQFAQYGARIRNEDSFAPQRLVPAIAVHARRVGADAICTHFSRALVTGHLAARVVRLPHMHYEHSSACYRKGLARSLSHYCLSRSDLVICNSKHTAASVARAHRLPARKLNVLHPPVEQREVTAQRESIRRALGLGAEDVLLGHIGGMIPQRDQRTLIKAFYKILALHPSARLILMGDGPERAGLESLARSLGVGAAVIFLGYTDRVGDYLSAMDLYVNSTLDEGFGIAVVEAMLARLPVVLADRGAHPELIVDGESGVLYRGEDANSLTGTLLDLVENAEKRRILGEAAFVHASSHFGPERFAVAFRELTDSIVASQWHSVEPPRLSDGSRTR